MCLVGMGFELEDSEQAIQAGKLSVREAVDWSVCLIAGCDGGTLVPYPPLYAKLPVNETAKSGTRFC